MIKLANGLLRPSEGQILIDGEPVGISSKKKISYLPDCISLPEWMRVSELIQFYESFYEDFNREKAYSMLGNLHISDNTRFKALSKGNKEKVQLILTMSRGAQLYLLDEPMGGVDPATRDYILNTIISNYSEHATVVISHTPYCRCRTGAGRSAIYSSRGNCFAGYGGQYSGSARKKR